MKVQELQAGDRFTQENHGELISFEVLAVESLGRQCRVWFESQLGRDSACYNAKAYIPATRFDHGQLAA
ncbi:hypothetical protein [Chitinimonas sp.]|uniref:hypothetical protein n=1 Tax=Chitinimonas sp. TaxID=1934313 RepID=UPI0035B37DDB